MIQPLGVSPRYIFEIDYKQDLDKCIRDFKKLYLPNRIEELKGAIKRYIDANLELNEGWVREYNQLIEELKEAQDV